MTFLYNAFTNTGGVACGIGNVLGAIPSKTWVDPPNYDFNLKSTSLAVDLTPERISRMPAPTSTRTSRRRNTRPGEA